MILSRAFLRLFPATIGADDLELETFYLAPDVSHFGVPFQNILVPKQVEIRVDCPPNIGSVFGDRRRLYTVLKALLANAVKFTDSGSIVLSVRRLEIEGSERVVFELNDTGIGLSSMQVETINSIFGASYAEAVQQGIQDGVIGAGLMIAARNCQLIGGRLTISSEFKQAPAAS